METNESDTATLLPNEVIKFEFRKNKENYLIVKNGILIKYGNVKIYALNIGVPNFIKRSPMDIKGQVDPNTIILGNFNAPVSFRGKSCKLKVKKIQS